MADSKDPHHNFELMKLVALDQAKKHNCNYTVILLNPNEKREFDLSYGSTYEMVLDSYFEKPRPNVIKKFETNHGVNTNTHIL